MPSHQGTMAVIRDGTVLLEKLRVLAAKLPDGYRPVLAGMLRATADEISPPTLDQRPAPVASSDPSIETAMQRVEDYFRARGNKPATLVEISNATGIPYVSIRTFVYKRHATKFHKTKSPAGKATLWQWAALMPGHGQDRKAAKG